MKKYSIISNKKRNELIERVVKNGQSVSRVSKQLRMKLPSAKSIIRTFKKSGKIFDKKKVISRKLNGKRAELSDTDNQSELSSQSHQKRQEKVVKEEMQERVQSNINQIKQGYPVTQSAFVPYQKIEDFGLDYYSQLFLNQQIAYYYNMLTYFQNQSFSNAQF